MDSVQTTVYEFGSAFLAKDGRATMDNGFRVSHVGPDVWVWRVRDGRHRVILERRGNRLCHSNSMPSHEESVPIDDKGASIHILSPSVQVGDKFIVAQFGESLSVTPHVRVSPHTPVHHTA